MSFTIPATVRETRGKGAARKMRAAGQIPSVIYGHGLDESISVTIDPKVLAQGLQQPKGFNTVFEVAVEGGATHQCFVRELQRNPVSRALLHCDLVIPDPERATVGEVPIHTTGRSIGVAMGGQVSVPYRSLKVLSKPADFPVDIVIDITKMDFNDVVKASEVPLPEGVTPIYDRDYVIVKVNAPRGKRAEDEAEVSTEEPTESAEA